MTNRTYRRLPLAFLAFLVFCAPALLHLTPAHARTLTHAQADDTAWAWVQGHAHACMVQGDAAQAWSVRMGAGWGIRSGCVHAHLSTAHTYTYAQVILIHDLLTCMLAHLRCTLEDDGHGQWGVYGAPAPMHTHFASHRLF